MESTAEQVYSFDDELVIETPEHVALYFVLANLGSRFLAAAIDHLIQALAIVAIGLAVYLTRTHLPDWALNKWIAAASVLITFAIYAGYFAAFETLWSGQTPGKRWLKLRVIRDDGRPINFFEATVRNLVRLLDMMPPSLIGLPAYAVGVISIIFSPESKRLGDYVAGTVVVKERSTEAPPLNEIVSLSEAEAKFLRRVPTQSFRAGLKLRTLGKDEVSAIEMFLRRRYDLNVESRERLAAKLAYTLCHRLDVDPNLMLPEDMIEEVNRQYQSYVKYIDR